MFAGLAELELGAAHDESGEQVEGVGRVSGGKVADLFVDELVGLSGDIAANKRRFEDVEGYVLAGCVGWRLVRSVDFGGEKSFSIFCAWSFDGG